MKPESKIKTNTVKMLPAKGTVSDKVKDYGNDPFFIKKAEQAKKRIERVGFPETFLTNNKGATPLK